MNLGMTLKDKQLRRKFKPNSAFLTLIEVIFAEISGDADVLVILFCYVVGNTSKTAAVKNSRVTANLCGFG